MSPLPKTQSTEKPAIREAYRQSLETLTSGEAPIIDGEALNEALLKLEPAIERINQKSASEIAAIMRSISDSSDLPEIESAARKLRTECRHVIVLGAGGSCLSGRALCMLPQAFDSPTLHFVDTIDPDYLAQLLQKLPLEDTGVIAISKSGGTVETLAILSALLGVSEQKNIRLASRAYAICREDESPLRSLANKHGFVTLEHDPDLCGRFSVFSAVGLLPAAVAGLNIRAIREGAAATLSGIRRHANIPCAPALGAACQWLLMQQQKTISVLMAYGEALSGVAWWHRQSWAESLGKSGKGSTPHASFGPSDQHSQLQLYLEGPRDKFFTLLIPRTQGKGLAIPNGTLDFLDGHTLGDVMEAESYATYESLVAARLPVRLLEVPQVNEAALGALYAHWIFEIVLVADLMNINPFDQPAVEESKRRARESLARSTP